MSAAEVIDILDEAGEVVGSMSREEAEKDNHITANVLVFIFNSVGKVWVQLRPQHKKHYGGLWDISACGGVLSGEAHDAAADRETLEETELEVELHFVESFLNVFVGDNGETRKRLSHLYIAVSDKQPQVNKEVDEFKLWEVEPLRADAENRSESYVPSFIVELDKAVASYEELMRGQG